MDELVLTLVGAAAGLVSGAVLAVLGSRQRREVEYDIDLRKLRIDAYKPLWTILEPLAYFSPPDEVTFAVSRELARALRTWYFEVGGLFLSEDTREAYFDLQKGLGGVIKEPLEHDHVPVDGARYQRLRASASKLRTATTRDVATRVDPKYAVPLHTRVWRWVSPPKLQVTVSRGWLWTEDARECYSVLVENPTRMTVVVNGVYFATDPEQSLLKEPMRLVPGGHWEIAVPTDRIPGAWGDMRARVNAELSDGTRVRAKPRRDIEPHPDFVADK
jgi:hypothetical protein